MQYHPFGKYMKGVPVLSKVVYERVRVKMYLGTFEYSQESAFCMLHKFSEEFC